MSDHNYPITFTRQATSHIEEMITIYKRGSLIPYVTPNGGCRPYLRFHVSDIWPDGSGKMYNGGWYTVKSVEELEKKLKQKGYGPIRWAR